MIVLELDIDHCCHWEKPCFAAPPLAGPPCRAALQSSVGLECAGMRSSTDCRKSTPQLAQYGQ